MQGISRLALLAALAATPAMAQEDEPIDLGTITLTASTEALGLSETGATVDVLTAEDLEAAPLSFGSFLSRLPGVGFNANGGLGTQAAIRIRGLSSYYVGTRIDGLDVTDPSGTQLSFNFAGLTTLGLSRIEVLRGSQSALYGSEAMAGVVDITTWRPEVDGTSGQVGLEAGSNATYSGSASVGFRDDRLELAFTASRTITDGISAFAAGTEDDAFRGTSASGYLRYQATDTLAFGVNILSQDSYGEYDSAAADADRFTDIRLRGARVFSELITGSVTHELSYAQIETERDVFEFGAFTYFVGDRKTLAYDGRWDGGDALSVNWGLEYKEEDFSVLSPWSAEANGVRTASVFAEVLYAPTDDLDLSLALRHDDHSLFGGQSSGRAALAWRPTEDWTIRAVAATGFRSPSPYELWSSFGDPTFQPEESRSFELGAERTFDAGLLRVTLFDTRIKDQITFDNLAFVYRQISGTTESRGVEIAGEYDLSSAVSLFGAYTYTETTLTDAGVVTRGIRSPRHVLLLGASAEVAPGWTLRGDVQHVADWLDDNTAVFPPVTVPMPDYTVANLALSYDINETTQAYLRVENLFDEDYQTVYNYGQPGRSVFVGLQAKF
jgi:vitamin B12 transporter